MKISFLVLFLSLGYALSRRIHEKFYFTIHDYKGEGCLEARKRYVRYVECTNAESQLWKFDELDYDNFIITNLGNGHVLDVEGGVQAGKKLITWEEHKGQNQQFRKKGLVFTVLGGQSHDGNPLVLQLNRDTRFVVLRPETGSRDQKFVLGANRHRYS